MYSLVYDGESKIYNFPLLDGMENGELRIVPLYSEFIVSRRVDHIFRKEDAGEVICYTGKVLSYDVATWLCSIIYEYEIDDGIEDEDDEPKQRSWGTFVGRLPELWHQASFVGYFRLFLYFW